MDSVLIGRFLYNPPSKTVIIELRSIGEEFFPNQLYIRQG